MHELKLYSPVGLNSLLGGSYESMMFADLVLTCGNGSGPVFRPVAHKCVLSAVSPFLKMLLDSNPDSNELIVPDVSPETMVWILQLIYTGETVVKSQPEICQIVEGVELLQIQIDGIQILPENKLFKEASSCNSNSSSSILSAVDPIAGLVGAKEQVDGGKSEGESCFHSVEESTFKAVFGGTDEDFLKDNFNYKNYDESESHYGHEMNQNGDEVMLVMKEEVLNGTSIDSNSESDNGCKRFKFSMTDEMISGHPHDEILMLDSEKSEVMELAIRAIAKDHGYNKYSRPGVLVPKGKRCKKISKLVDLESDTVVYTD